MHPTTAGITALELFPIGIMFLFFVDTFIFGLLFLAASSLSFGYWLRWKVKRY